jgi:hypothetical protein
MKIQIRKVFALLFFVAVSIGCSVEKRQFRDGYFVQWHSGRNDFKQDVQPQQLVQRENESNRDVSPNIGAVAKQDVKMEKPMPVAHKITSSINRNQEPQQPELSKQGISISADCDVLIMKSGDEIQAKILEVGESEIRYRACDNPDGPIMVISTSRVFKIKYANGSSQVIAATDNAKENEDPILGESAGKSQIVAFILCFFFGWIGVHRFYLGYTGIAIVQLLTFGGCGVWYVIDLIMILTGDLKPRYGDYKDKF